MSSTTADDGTAEAETDTNGETDTETDTLTLVEAVRDALYTELSLDERVMILGEDVGENGGVFRATAELVDEFSAERVVDTPLAESGIVGTGIGLALSGLRPVAELQFMGFSYPAFDQLVSHAARLRSRSNGQYSVPMVIRMPYGGGIRAPEHHSESKEAFFVHEPGLKVAVPSSPADAKGLLIAAIRDPDPVVFLEPKLIYRAFREDVPTAAYEVPLGEASVRREGTDVTVYTWGAMIQPTLIAADNVADEAGIEVEVVDLRTLSPLDIETIVESFERTGRAVIAHEAPKTAGVGAEIAATIQEEALLYQQAPIRRVTGYDVPMPLHELEEYYLPQAIRIEEAIRETVSF